MATFRGRKYGGGDLLFEPVQHIRCSGFLPLLRASGYFVGPRARADKSIWDN
jgi:hypothetical protein